MAEKRILLVDDELAILKMYSRAFTKAGYTLKTAASAEEALEIQQKDQYGIMSLDLNLPKMNGVDLCPQIRRD